MKLGNGIHGFGSLGQMMHAQFHALKRRGDEEPPGLGSTSIIQPGLYDQRSQLYPRPAFTRYIDRQEWRKRRTGQMREALPNLAAHNWRWARMIEVACVDAEPEDVGLAKGDVPSHRGAAREQAANLLVIEGGGYSKAAFNREIDAGWEWLAVLWAEKGDLEEAIGQGAVNHEALAWLATL